MLDLIAIKGCTVTIDAIGCQTDIVEKIIKAEANYVLAVKGNQPELQTQVTKLFDYYQDIETFTNIDAGHGRIEIRTCSVINDLRFLDEKENWKESKSIIRLVFERTDKTTGKTSSETRYYISILTNSAKKAEEIVRSHWAIENNLHWRLDVTFGEDDSRRRKGDIAPNFNIISKTAMMLLDKIPKKMSMNGKRTLAAFDLSFRDLIFNS